MKFLMLISTSLFALSANARLTQFNCTTNENLYGDQKHTINFQIENLNSKNPEFVSSDENGECPISGTPKRSPLLSLCENVSIEKDSEKIDIDADADGFYLLNLVLYKDSGWKAGYVRVNDIGASLGGSAYSTLTCVVEEL